MFETKKRLLPAMYRLEESMQGVLEKLEALERNAAPRAQQNAGTKGGDEWLREGIDSILSYQAGGKKLDGEEKQV